ncbi:MAG: hypothetical protein ACRDXX_03905 [Stackebrandtia sp.]
MPPLAGIDALETLLAEPLTGRQRQRAASVLTGVSAEVRAAAGRSWVDGDAPELAVSITLRAAERVVRNPQGLTSERLGDYGRGFGDTAPAGVYLTEGERNALAELVDAGDLVSVPVEREVIVSDRPWSYPTERL